MRPTATSRRPACALPHAHAPALAPAPAARRPLGHSPPRGPAPAPAFDFQAASASATAARDSLLASDDRAAAFLAGLRASATTDRAFATTSDVRLAAADSGAGGDALPLAYDPAAIDAFWARRPVAVIQRVLQVTTAAGGYAARLTWDRASGGIKAPGAVAARAAELRDVLTSLGPAAIKAGQALSLRPDILAPDAMVELQQLCDKVPSFDDGEAFAVIEAELGAPPATLFKTIGATPVAAASLGQVYKATLHSGEEVAVKVQRPGVLETVSVDLFLARRFGVFLRRFNLRVDVVGLLDEWATRFYEELDYVNEGG